MPEQAPYGYAQHGGVADIRRYFLVNITYYIVHANWKRSYLLYSPISEIHYKDINNILTINITLNVFGHSQIRVLLPQSFRFSKSGDRQNSCLVEYQI